MAFAEAVAELHAHMAMAARTNAVLKNRYLYMTDDSFELVYEIIAEMDWRVGTKQQPAIQANLNPNNEPGTGDISLWPAHLVFCVLPFAGCFWSYLGRRFFG
jgi:hypothetical protein